MSVGTASMGKITKKPLKSIVKDRQFTDDCMYSFLAEVESIVNSRSLTNVSVVLDHSEALTPNHFLV